MVRSDSLVWHAVSMNRMESLMNDSRFNRRFGRFSDDHADNVGMDAEGESNMVVRSVWRTF